MKQISKKLILKKKTVAVLNEQELSNVVGGAETHQGPRCQLYNSIDVCPPVTKGVFTKC